MFGPTTGSYPPGCHGWHRPIRFIAIHDPRPKPYTPMASCAYCEQVGANRHRDVVPAQRNWYPRMARRPARAAREASLTSSPPDIWRRSLTIPGKMGRARTSSRRSGTPIRAVGARSVGARRPEVVCAGDSASLRCHWRGQSRTQPLGKRFRPRRPGAPRVARHVAVGPERGQQRSHGCELGESGRNPGAASRSA